MLAGRAKLRILVGAHPAVGIGTVNAFRTVASSFVESCFRILSDEVFPFAFEVDFCSNVFLPWLYIVGIHGYFLCVVGIFIGKSCEAVAELMHDNRPERGVVSRTQVIAIENAAAAIAVGIDENDDVLIGNARQLVVKLLEMLCGKVAVAIEGVVAGEQGCLFPDAFVRDADTALLGRRLYGYAAELGA